MFSISLMPASYKPAQAHYTRTSFIILCLGLGLAHCSDPLPHEQQIENAIKQIASAVEQLDANALEEHLATDINLDNKGKSLEMEQIRKIMMLYRFKKQTIRVNIAKVDIEMDAYSSHLAKANITALVTGSKGLLPNDGKLYHIESQWRLYDGQWKLQQASWQ